MHEIFATSDITNQLSQILLSPGFKNSRILSAFLTYIINQTLEGKEREIKEYSIGMNVLARETDFNPQLDSIVRIHAGRLRRALKEYYYEQGKDDKILIEIPKGSYIPVFSTQTHQPPAGIYSKLPGERIKPVIAVLPFRNISHDHSRDFFADGLGEQLSSELARFQDVSVISYYSSRHVAGKTTDIKEAGMLLGSQYILTGNIQNDNKKLRIGAQLILCSNGEQLWANSFERKNTTSGLFDIQNEIVKNILTAIGGYYGAIFRNEMHHLPAMEDSDLQKYDAIFWYYYYQKVSTKEVMQNAIQALEAAVKLDPQYALAWAVLGELYLDDKAFEFKKIDNPIEEGLRCARLAVSIDPNCQHGYLTLSWGHLFMKNKEEAIKSAEICLSINPNSADMMGAMGFVFICAGEFERGYQLLNQSIIYNPYCPWWFYSGFALYFLQKKDYQQTFYWAEKVNQVELIWDPLMKTSALGHLNRKQEAARYYKPLQELVFDSGTPLKEIVQTFLLSDELNSEILLGVEKAC